MSSVRKKDRSTHRFTVLDIVLDAYDHTSTVIANRKIFTEEYKSLIDRIDNEASLMYHCCRLANNEYDNRVQDEAEMRIRLEEEAMEHCMWLRTDILLAQRKFHLRASKVVYWDSLVKKALDAIKGWHTSELKQYKSTYGL